MTKQALARRAGACGVWQASAVYRDVGADWAR